MSLVISGKRNFLVTNILHNIFLCFPQKKKMIHVDLGEKSIDALNGSEHDKCVVLIASCKYNEFSQNV